MPVRADGELVLVDQDVHLMLEHARSSLVDSTFEYTARHQPLDPMGKTRTVTATIIDTFGNPQASPS